MSDIKNIKGTEPEAGKKSLTMEVFEEQKRQNRRMAWIAGALIAAFFVVVPTIVIAFLLYLNSYDFSSTVEQEGVYAMIDSDGNVISSDISPDQILQIMEILNDGNNESNED